MHLSIGLLLFICKKNEIGTILLSITSFYAICAIIGRYAYKIKYRGVVITSTLLWDKQR
jgi:hypothetical protein